MALAQQVAATGELVTRLMADHRREDTRDAGVGRDRGHHGP
jgi:hypothetical protein